MSNRSQIPLVSDMGDVAAADQRVQCGNFVEVDTIYTGEGDFAGKCLVRRELFDK